MLMIPKCLKEHKAGTWKPCNCGPNGSHAGLLTCPDCGTVMHLREYSIIKDGIVVEEVQCVNNRCDWADEIQLAGWDDGA